MDACKNEWLRGRVQQVFGELKQNCELGDKVPKIYWPSYYRKELGISNLYVTKLGPDWRLTYTLIAEGAGISAVCLEILTHKDYDNRFGYRTS